MIRNGVRPDAIERSRDTHPGPSPFGCRDEWSNAGRPVPTNPAAPRRSSQWQFLADLTGPAVAAFNAIGTATNGRLAESRQRDEVMRVRHVLGSGDLASLPPIANLDLKHTKTVFPLGWYLS